MAIPQPQRQDRRIAYGHRLHQQQPAPDDGHYLQSKVRSDVWAALQELRQQHDLTISGAAHHLMRLGAGLDPLPPLNQFTRTERCASSDGN